MKSFENSKKSSEAGHIAALDGVRGLAILLVIAYHVAYKLPASFYPTDWWDKLTFFGVFGLWVGVDLFFVLSGYLITGILLSSRSRHHYFRNFIARRALRIFPLYYFFLVLCFALLPFLPLEAAEKTTIAGSKAWAYTYTYNYFVDSRGWNLISHIWSLAIEEQFYLLWPAVIFFLAGPRLKIAVLGLVPLALVARYLLQASGHEIGAYTFLIARVDALALGAATAIFTPKSLNTWRWRWPTIALSLIGIGLVAIKERSLHHEDTVVVFLPTLCAILFAFIVAQVAGSPDRGLAKLFAHPVLRWFGTYSYALYLFHPLVLLYLGLYAVPMASSLPLTAQYVLLLAVTLLLTSVIARSSWILIEAPFLKLKKYFAASPPRMDPKAQIIDSDLKVLSPPR